MKVSRLAEAEPGSPLVAVSLKWPSIESSPTPVASAAICSIA